MRALRWATQALWSGVIPALLAGLVLKFLVPPMGLPGARGIVADLGHRYPVAFGAACFLLFSALASHWSFLVLPEAQSVPPAPRARLREAILTVGAVAFAAGFAIFARRTLVQPYKVLSGSMIPTLEPGDEIAANKLAYRSAQPRRGDIVTFQSSAVAGSMAATQHGRMPDVMVKRVIGLPGDRITMHDGVPVINGWEVPSCVAADYFYLLPDGGGDSFRALIFVEFLEDRVYLTAHALGMPAFEGVYKVQPGEVFVLGDNRTNSFDSRSYRNKKGGGVPMSAIDARADWYLLGSRTSGDPDTSRLFQRLDKVERHVHREQMNWHDIEAGISRCLEQPPAVTHPPDAGEPSASESSPRPPT
jgi:signal peptidase I